MIKQFRDSNYYCTPYGEIYRKKKDGAFRKCNPSADKFGYRFISLMINKKPAVMKAHRVIFEAWNGPILNGLTIDHVDFNKDNNNLLNLKLMTKQENSSKKQRSLSGTNSPRAKLTEDMAKAIHAIEGRVNYSRLSRMTGISRNTLRKIRNEESYRLNTVGIE